MKEPRQRVTRHPVPSKRNAVRSGIGICLAIAAVYSFSYESPAPAGQLMASSSQTLLANGTTQTKDRPTGIVEPKSLALPGVAGESPSSKANSRIISKLIADALSKAETTPPAVAGMSAADIGDSSSVERPSEGTLISPLASLNPSSPFGFRTSPITGAADEFHTGQDFAAPCGTLVYAADAGVVRAAGWHPWGGGNRVEVDHGNGLVTTYNHLEAIGVDKGDVVGPGAVIAKVGTTGWSTGCHLHFETILNGEHVDPRKWTLVSVDRSQATLAAMDTFAPGSQNSPAEGTQEWAVSLLGSHAHEVVDTPVAKYTPATTGHKPSATTSPTSKPSATTSTHKPTPSPTPSDPAPTHKPTPSPTPSDPAPTPDPTPGDPAPTNPAPTNPAPTPDPTPTDRAPTPTPDPSPTPDPTLEPTPLPDPTPTPDPDPSPSPTPEPEPAPSPDPTPTEPAPTEPAPTAPTPTEPAPTATLTACEPDPGVAPEPGMEPVAEAVVTPETGTATEPELVADPVTGAVGEPVPATDCLSPEPVPSAETVPVPPARTPETSSASETGG